MLTRIWRFCCSLKLAIVLASAVTLLGMAGSLVIHFNPRVFGAIDDLPLWQWWQASGSANINLSWWLSLTALLLVLFGLNTCCCFLDWLLHLSARWRKLGEYLIHLGFILMTLAFIWGSLAGSRSGALRLSPGQLAPIAAMPGHYLRLDRFQPKLGPGGRPLDMINQISLLKGDQLITNQTMRLNHPLIYKDLVVVPFSFGRTVTGFSALIPGLGTVELRPGTRLNHPNGSRLKVLQFLPDARETGRRVGPGMEQLGNPAFELELNSADGSHWRGWYFLRRQLPLELVKNGLRIWPKQPLSGLYSILQANTDPGARLALAGGIAFFIGALLALVSFYRKRRRGEHPCID